MERGYNSPKYLYPGIEGAAHPYKAVAALKEYCSPTEESFCIFSGLLLARRTWEQPQTVGFGRTKLMQGRCVKVEIDCPEMFCSQCVHHVCIERGPAIDLAMPACTGDFQPCCS